MLSLLKNIPLFSSLNDDELDAIHRVSITKRFSKDHLILLENEEGDTLFIILDGKVKVTSYSSQGKEVIFSLLNDGDFFGEMSLLDGKPRSASVVTVKESEICLIRRSDFIALLEKKPSIALQLLAELTSRLRKTDERIESLALLDVTGRVAGILLQLARDTGMNTAGGLLIRNRPTHQELANMVGTTRETVTRILKQLEAKDYIILDGKDITISQPDVFKRDLYL